MNLEELLDQIHTPDAEAMASARRRWDALAKPLGSLGRLEESVIRIAGTTGNPDVRLDRRALLVFCADHGVVAQGVTQCGSEVTAAVARALAAGESTVCHMARAADCKVIPVNVGMADASEIPGVIARPVRKGTEDMTIRAAMGRAECVSAILTGAELVGELAAQGTQIIDVGEMGIGNTTAASAVTSVLLGLPPERVTGRGAGLSSAGFSRKRYAVRRAIAVNAPDADDPIDVLTRVGGLELAAMCGAFLGGAAYRVPVVMDGVISAAAALCAVRLCPGARGAILPSHESAEPAGRLLLDALDFKPLLTAELHLGEGSGAVAVLPLLDMALSVYHSGQTFGRLGIEAYTPQN